MSMDIDGAKLELALTIISVDAERDPISVASKIVLAELETLQSENASLWALAKFGRWSLGFHLEGYHEKYSSYARDAAFDLGILEEVRVEKPCSSNCQCKFYDNIFPRNCVRETPLAQLPERRE